MQLQYRFLWMDTETEEIRLLGYRLSLSPTERRILAALLGNESLSIEALTQISNPPLSRASIPVHIHAINKKAAAISGRRLIAFEDGAYRILAEM